MNRITAKKVLWVQTIEACDASGAVFPFEERSRCTLSVLPEGYLPGKLSRRACENVLLRRADAALSYLLRLHGQVASPPKRHLPWPLIISAICLLAFAAGMASDRIVNRSTINVISLPLLGILGWNFLIYLWNILTSLLPRQAREPSMGLRALLATAIGIGRSRQTTTTQPGGTPEWDKSRGNFMANWAKIVGRSELLTLSTTLHLAAASLALGQIGSLYLGGLVRRYNAVWESTFLDRTDFEKLAQLLFAPARWFTGIPIEITAQMEAGAVAAGVPAGNWIHLCATTLFLLVVLPRLALAMVTRIRAGAAWQKAARQMELVDYTDTLLRLAKGTGMHVSVINCCPELPEGSEDHLIRGLKHAIGRPGSLRFFKGSSLGEPDDYPAELKEKADLLLFLFPLHSTPEDETHGQLTEAVCRMAKAREPDNCRTVGLLFADRFDSRFRNLPEFEDRLRERERAWSEVLARRGITSLMWNTDTPVSDLGSSLVDALAISDQQSMVTLNS